MKVSVITISDRAASGEYEDLSGPEIEKILKESFDTITVTRNIIPDEPERIKQALNESLDSNYILTTGGTGLSDRDVTPEISKEFCDKEIPGIAEALRAESYKETKNAMLSRGFAGIKNKTIIVNFPGSVKAVRLCTQTIVPVMQHAIAMLNNEKH